VICPASPCPANYPASFPAGLAGTPVPAGSYYNPTATKPNPAIANTWTYFSEADSAYNALQIDLNHRFSKRFSLRGVYTWSKTIDDGDSLNATTSGNEPALRRTRSTFARTGAGEFRRPKRGGDQRTVPASFGAQSPG